MNDSQDGAEQPAVEVGQLQLVPFNADDADSDDGREHEEPDGPDGPHPDGPNPDGQEPLSAASLAKMHVNQIWDFLESTTASVSAQSLASVREKEKHAGAKSGTVIHWPQKN